MLSRPSEYWGLAASSLSADSAVGTGLFISQKIAGQRRGGRATGRRSTFAVLGGIEGCVKQLGDVANVCRHGGGCARRREGVWEDEGGKKEKRRWWR